MTQKSKKHGKSVLSGRSIRGTKIGTSLGALKEHKAAPISIASKSIHHVGMPVHILTKEDIKKEIAEGEKRFGMPADDFYKAWQNGKFHGFQAMKLGCLYELYKDEYE
jgi:hypothetical protein